MQRKKTPKEYILTDEGLSYVEKYQPKEQPNEQPKNQKSQQTYKPTTSSYSSLCADDLYLNNYPEIKKLDTFKKQMILTLFIVTKEGKGEFFTVSDIQSIMTDILGLPASVDQINGIFKHNRTWFKKEQDDNNKKAYKRKLLQGAIDFAQSIIDNN